METKKTDEEMKSFRTWKEDKYRKSEMKMERERKAREERREANIRRSFIADDSPHSPYFE